MSSTWRNFKNIFSRPLFTIIFRSEMLTFHPYSILTGDTRVEFVIYSVLKESTWKAHLKIGLINKGINSGHSFIENLDSTSTGFSNAQCICENILVFKFDLETFVVYKEIRR